MPAKAGDAAPGAGWGIRPPQDFGGESGPGLRRRRRQVVEIREGDKSAQEMVDALGEKLRERRI